MSKSAFSKSRTWHSLGVCADNPRFRSQLIDLWAQLRLYVRESLEQACFHDPSFRHAIHVTRSQCLYAN